MDATNVISAPVTRAKWATVRLALGTVGRLSTGISIGHRHGFDSGTMLDYVYRNEPHGRLGIGRILDPVYLDAGGRRAIRPRRRLLPATLRTEIERGPCPVR